MALNLVVVRTTSRYDDVLCGKMKTLMYTLHFPAFYVNVDFRSSKQRRYQACRAPRTTHHI